MAWTALMMGQQAPSLVHSIMPKSLTRETPQGTTTATIPLPHHVLQVHTASQQMRHAGVQQPVQRDSRQAHYR